MTVSQALNTVSAAYVPGVAGHYDRMETNPWQRAHDDLERLMLMRDPELVHAGIDRFASECLRLIKAFEEISAPAKRLTNQDAFHIGDEDKVRQWQSRKYKQCFKCDSKEGLSLISHPKDKASVLIICRECKQKAGA